jgi:CheY-like chemotaxis protein
MSINSLFVSKPKLEKGIMSKDLILLIAEDDTASFILTKRLLKRWGINAPLIRFTDGRTLLDFLYTATIVNKPTEVEYLLFLDINMPDIDGFKVLTKMKNSPQLKHIPVIILTAIEDQFTKQHCLSLGCDAFFTKPLKHDQLLAALNKFQITLPQQKSNQTS